MSRVGKAYKQSGTVRAWRTAFKAGVRAPKVQRMSAVAQEGLASILQRAVDALEARSERGTALSPPKTLLVRVAPSSLSRHGFAQLFIENASFATRETAHCRSVSRTR